MWEEVLRNRKLGGLKFHRQKPLDEYIADFYCSELKLIIEIDGSSHSEKEAKENDKERTLALNQFNIKVIRYTNDDVLNNLSEVRKNLIKNVEKRRKELNN